ncbi:MAG: hypothetical protein CMJ12_02350 [Pelagibacterales bacterium]|nr:hypothetical protein [Pelagibacterales bacterium]|tara:strand:- start:181 stop:735 length:555 start_codon:yes stop_codon:yes gene_type:complete
MINLFKIFKSRDDITRIEKFYNNIVILARNKNLYIEGGVPDTLDGRFELIILHCHLFVKRLLEASSQEKQFAQEIIDYMFKDFDRSLREIGVGDLSVGKKIKFMVSSYYGRANTYQNALIKGGKTLDDALKKNLYGTNTPNEIEIKYIKIYIDNLTKYLASLKNEEILICFQNNVSPFVGIHNE